MGTIFAVFGMTWLGTEPTLPLDHWASLVLRWAKQDGQEQTEELLVFHFIAW